MYSNLRPLGINLLKCAFSSTHLSYYNSKVGQPKRRSRRRQTREQERHTTTNNRHSTPKTKNTWDPPIYEKDINRFIKFIGFLIKHLLFCSTAMISQTYRMNILSTSSTYFPKSFSPIDTQWQTIDTQHQKLKTHETHGPRTHGYLIVFTNWQYINR
jgi:hypothetical protein